MLNANYSRSAIFPCCRRPPPLPSSSAVRHGDHIDKVWHSEPEVFYVDNYGNHYPAGRHLMEQPLAATKKATKAAPKGPKDAVKLLAGKARKAFGLPRSLQSTTSANTEVVVVVDRPHHHHHGCYNSWCRYGRKMMSVFGL